MARRLSGATKDRRGQNRVVILALGGQFMPNWASNLQRVNFKTQRLNRPVSVFLKTFELTTKPLKSGAYYARGHTPSSKEYAYISSLWSLPKCSMRRYFKPHTCNFL